MAAEEQKQTGGERLKGCWDENESCRKDNNKVVKHMIDSHRGSESRREPATSRRLTLNPGVL